MKQIPFPKRKYNIIYADPPWNRDSQAGRDKKKGNEPYFPLMALEDIKSLPVDNLADTNCVLFLWVLDAWLFESKEVIDSWGFTYKTVGFTWIKKTSTGKDCFGMGVWTRKNPETCLIAVKGHPKRMDAGVRQLQRYERKEPCRKPNEIRDEIVRLCGDLPRIELFARQRTKGWDTWGNETQRFSK